MKTLPRLLPCRRSHLVAQAWALVLLTSLAPAQVAPARSVDAATLAKYDANKNGRLDPAEQAALDADQRKAASVATAAEAGGPKASDDIISLSPFEVVSDTKGYYSANTMSGTRFNSKLEDLAASITVVTKEQMADFAMLDINDVFQYTANTEGTGTYTDLTIDRNGSVSDNVQLNPTQANRVRGLGAANISLGNFETMGRVPVDPIAIDAIELNRGPNANVFGLGNPSGTVNQVAASANLSRDRSQVQFRGDSYDGYRTSLDVNRVLVKGTLAVRGSAVYQHDGFVRKPSGVDTERYNGMIKYQPFRGTTFSAAVNYYHSYGTRPNFSNPRDSLSYWIQSGRPTWDPINQVVHVNGQTLGPFTADTNVPDYFNRTFTGNNHSYLYIDQGGISYFGASQTFSSLTTGPISGGQTVRLMSPSPASGTNLGKFTNQPLFTTTPSVKDKSIYDWTSTNLAAVNRDWDRVITSSLQLDQMFLNTPRQTLFGQLAFFREDALRYRRDYVGIANDNGQSGQLLVDVNERMLDGTPNPFLGRPYIGQDQPRTIYNPAKWDTYRAQLSYKLDLTQEKGALKWLGRHELSGYDEYKYRLSRRYSYREAILDAHPWIAAGVSRGNQGAVTNGPAAALAITRSYLRYYVGDNQGNNIDYAPSDFRPGTYPFVWGTYTFANQTVNGQTASLPVAGSGVFNREPSQFGLAAVTDSTGAGSNAKTILKTIGAVIQSHFLDERLVTTFGLREDKQYSKAGSTPQLLNADGTTFNFESINHWAAGDYKFNSGKTKQAGAVVRPFRGLSALRSLNEGGLASQALGSALQGLFLTYNKSDSFQPADPRHSLFFKPLPNPSGNGKDYGFGLNMFDGKLVARFNHYETKQLNFRQGDAGTIAQRVTRIDITSTAAFLPFTQAVGTPTTPGWIRVANPTFTEAQLQAEFSRQLGLSTETQNAIIAAFNAGTISSTQDVTAKGNEVEIFVNPTRYWTITASATDTRSFNSNVSNDIADWIAQRMPIWTTLVDTRFANDPNPAQRLWWTHTGYGGSQTAAQNFGSFVDTPYNVVKQQEGKSNPQVRRYAAKTSTNFRLAGITDQRHLKRMSIGGALRWEAPGAIGYYGLEKLPAVITRLDPNNPIYDKAHLYIDAFASYQTKLWADKISATFRLNVQNIQENGRLQPIAAYPDGTPNAYRIVDPRKFILTVTFDL